MWNVFTYTLLNQCGHMGPRPPLSGLSNEISMRPQIFKNLTWFNYCCNQCDYTWPYFTNIYTHIHHHGIISAQRLTLSPQLLTIKPRHLPQRLSLISHGVALQLRTSSCPWDRSAVLTTLLYLQSSLPPTVFSPGRHTQTDLVWKEEVLKAGLDQMTQWRREAPCERGDKL